jgi:hypothetical protein
MVWYGMVFSGLFPPSILWHQSGIFWVDLCILQEGLKFTLFWISIFSSNMSTSHSIYGTAILLLQLSRYNDWLLVKRSGDRIPVGVRFSAPVQTDPGSHPAFCAMGTGSFPGVEYGRGVTLTHHPLLVPRSESRVDLYPYSPQGPPWPVKRVKPTILLLYNM